jgi:ABC-type Fe3+ transport system permease subunit
MGLVRMLRFGPALYRSSRKLGGSRWRALCIVVWP